MKKFIISLLATALALGSLAGCSSNKNSSNSKLVVGASPTPHSEILEVCKEVLAEQGITLEIKEFTDFVQPNLALENKDLDANYFQHKPYLDDFNQEKSTHLVSVYAPHYEPFGIYPGKTKSLDDLKDGATVAVPNDTTNEARALVLLEANGLIKLNPDAGLKATKKDITENQKNLDIKEIEAAQLPRSIQDVDIAAINGNYAIQAGLHADKDALAVEADDSESATTYANIIAVREGDEERPEIKALIDALKSKKVTDFITEHYEGAVIPMK